MKPGLLIKVLAGAIVTGLGFGCRGASKLSACGCSSSPAYPYLS